MRMLRWTTGKTNNYNIKNEDIWREKRQYRTNDNLPQKEMTDMVWSRVNDGRGGYHQEDDNHMCRE